MSQVQGDDQRLRDFLDERERHRRRRNIVFGALGLLATLAAGRFVVDFGRHIAATSTLQARGVRVDLYFSSAWPVGVPRSSAVYAWSRFTTSEPLRPEDAALLESLLGLESLDLTNAPGVKREFINRLGTIDTLTDLRLEFGETGGLRSRGGLKDDALDAIGRFSKLEILSLAGQRVTDAGLPKLMGLDRLQDLDLDRTGVTDAGIMVLGRLPQLHFLRLADTKVTDEGVMAFQRAYPNVTVVRITE